MLATAPTCSSQYSIKKLETVINEWNGLQKYMYKKRKGATHKAQEKDFVAKLDILFDIAHGDALTIIEIPEDR